MSKGMRSLAKVMTPALLSLPLVLSGLLLTAIACEGMTTGTSTSPSISIESVAEVATTTATTATATTTPGGKSRADDVAESAGPADDASSNIETSSSVLWVAPTAASMIPMPTWTRFEETDPHLGWVGIWGPVHRPSLVSGDWFRSAAEEVPSHVALMFEGTRVRLVAPTDAFSGIGRITLDDDVFSADFYSESCVWIKIVWTSPVLASGIHFLRLEWTGDRNPASLDSNISLDAVDVIGTLAEP